MTRDSRACPQGARLPKQNRPLIRDGRLQATKKKRTDRSYLRPAPEAAPAPLSEDEAAAAEARAEEDVLGEAPAPVSAAVPSRAVAEAMPRRLPASVRAIQQQGVRTRRQLDLNALAESDTRYALHELRRIAVLAAMVVVTLVVLGIVLR